MSNNEVKPLDSFPIASFPSQALFLFFECGIYRRGRARALVVAELCWTSLGSYPLATFVLSSERALEISFAFILVVLVAFGARYMAVLSPVERNIVIGLGAYSCFQVINNTFMQQ